MDQSVTSVSLLHRIKEDRHDEKAWREFVDRYGTRVYRWCLIRRLQPEDAEDVTQNVLLRLAASFEKFEYDPRQSFRGWLRRVTENAIKDFAKSQSRHHLGQGGSAIASLMDEVPTRTELVDYLAEAFDLEVLDEAKSRVQTRVKISRWMSWDLLCNQANSAKEVAERLGISVGVVYANKNQVQNLIKAEIEYLEGKEQIDTKPNPQT